MVRAMPHETASPEVEDVHLSMCIHCRKRAVVERLGGANLCAGCVAKRVRPRYDIERAPEHVACQAKARRLQVDGAEAVQAANRRSQDLRRAAEAARIAIAKADPEPVKPGSQLRDEARAQSGVS